MDSLVSSPSKEYFNLFDHCFISSNRDGDSFVGIETTNDEIGYKIFFPLGFKFPETETELREDIQKLIEILTKYSNSEGKLFDTNDNKEQISKFPFNSYKDVIDYYFLHGAKYYVEKEEKYRTSDNGIIDWTRTINKHHPHIQRVKGKCNIIYTDFEVKVFDNNENQEITFINKYCVYRAFQQIGWLYGSYLPEKCSLNIDLNLNAAIAVVQKKLFSTNDDDKRILFESMLNILRNEEIVLNNMKQYIGTYHFEKVWEWLIDKAYGISDKEQYFPRAYWKLKGNKDDKYVKLNPLIPDTIMVVEDNDEYSESSNKEEDNRKIYILDAKYYKYGVTANPNDLPNTSSVCKQISYGEYLEKYLKIEPKNIFNAFVMPYNMFLNEFNSKNELLCIGAAEGEWRTNVYHYEHILGILLDTKYLMYNYNKNQNYNIKKLATLIEDEIAKIEN